MNKQTEIISFDEENKVHLVRFGAVAIESLTGNKKLPIIGLDLSNRPDIEEMLLIHGEMPPGDVFTQWAADHSSKKLLVLFFKFERPSRIGFYVPLYFHEHSWVIEGIIQTKAILLKSGHAEESTEEMIDGLKESISVEIGGSADIPGDWEKWQLKAIQKHLIQNGLEKKEALVRAKEQILSDKSFWAEPVDYPDD